VPKPNNAGAPSDQYFSLAVLLTLAEGFQFHQRVLFSGVFIMSEQKKAATSKTSTAATKKKATTTRKTGAPANAAKAKAPSKAKGPQHVTIDGREYALDALSDNAKAQINNLRATDRVIEELKLELAISNTARASYAQALEQELKAMNSTLQ
jgi:hypothetical protein